MVEFLLGLFSNLISSWLGKLNVPRLFPSSQTRFWDSIFKGGLVIVTPGSEEEANVKSQVFDFLGLDELKTHVINKYYQGKYKQTTCENVSTEWLNRNLLLVAGPIPNTTTRHILNQENKSVRYYFNGNNIIDKEDANGTIQASIGSQGSPLIDYGIISKLRNPFNRNKWVVIACGMYGWGTYAALIALAKKDILDIIRQHAENKEFQVLVQTRIYNRISEEPTLIGESMHIVVENKGTEI